MKAAHHRPVNSGSPAEVPDENADKQVRATGQMLSPDEAATLHAIGMRLSETDPALAESLRRLRPPSRGIGPPGIPTTHEAGRRVVSTPILIAVLLAVWIFSVGLVALGGDFPAPTESGLRPAIAPAGGGSTSVHQADTTATNAHGFHRPRPSREEE